MSLRYYGALHRLHCGLVWLVLALIVMIAILVSSAGQLRVARVPPVSDDDLTTMQSGRNNTHVIIVGAGAAGLSAAYTLEYVNVPYTLLEASATFGGRVREMTDFIDNVPLDVGAEWIHVMPRVLQDLLLFPEDDASLIDIIDYQPQTISFFRRGKRRRRNFFRFFYQEYKFRNTTWWSYFSTFFYPYVAESIRFNAVVDRIEYQQHPRGSQQTASMTVTTVDGRQFVGTHVILAVPASMLQDRTIDFTPNMDESFWRTMDDVAVADGLKVWLEFDERFYPDLQATQSMLHSLEAQPLFFDAVFRKHTDKNVLCLFNVNQKEASKMATKSDTEIVEETMGLLQKIFDRSDLKEHLLQSRVLNWSREPLIRGAYTWNYGDYDQTFLRRSLYDGHLWLAGEYLARSDTATVHGAAISGREAALQILSNLQEQQA